MTPASNSNDEEALVLSPFVVDAAEEKGSYKANSTLAGTRVRTDLADNATALSVVTAQFLQDTGASNAQDLLIYTPNTEVAGLNGNFSGQAGNAQFNENVLTPSTVTRVRGLSAADNTRDYFLTEIPWDSFNVGRVDLSRGPNSILFGVGSPGGIINNDINDAEFTNSNNVSDRFDGYGSFRNSADFNYVVIPNKLAIRLSWVNDEEKYMERYTFNNTTRYYGAVRYDPQLFGKDNHTSIRVKFEKGTVSSNNPRTLPPVDEITQWFQYGKPTLNEWSPTYSNGSAVLKSIPLISEGVIGGWAQGRTYWQDVLNYYNGNSAPIKTVSGFVNTTILNPTAIGVPVGTGVGDLPFNRPYGIPDYNMFAQNGGVAQGGSYYYDKVLTDSSVFNFFDSTLDGPNERQWQGWTALNASLSQTFFHDRLGFQLVYDQQRYNNGQIGNISGPNYAVTVDIQQTYADGSANPNFGRPMVAAADAYGNNSSVVDRNALRFTATGELRADDFVAKGSWIDRIFGHHTLTFLDEEDHKKEQDISWSQYATTADWEIQNDVGLNNAIQEYRQFDWVAYIGGNALGRSSASGINAGAIGYVLSPGAQQVVNNFNATWNATSVNPAAPYSYVDYTTGTIDNGTQKDNPANYVGWQQQSVTWLNANNPSDFPNLVTGGQKTSFTDASEGFTWQGNMLDGTFIPTFGWRKDHVVNYATQAPELSTNTFVATDYGNDPNSRREAIGETKAYGAVFHFPKNWTKWLPGGTQLSVFFDHNANFQAQAPRTSLTGSALPNPTGKTKEYGIAITTLNDKLTFKVDWYRTQIQNATLDSSNDGGLGGNGYQIWALPAWGYQYAAALQDGITGKNNPANYWGNWNYGYIDQGSGLPGHTGNTQNVQNPNDPDVQLEQNIVNAWLNTPIPAGFFAAYGLHPNPINPAAAKASGVLTDAFGGTSFNDAGPGSDQPGALAPVTTVDTLSRGQEFELSAQPTRNWNITLNYTRTFATHANIDALTVGLMNQITTWFNGPAGQLRLWGGYGSPIYQSWIANVWNPYLVEINSQGQSAPEVSPWRLNLVTTYSFDHGKLKGYFIGGAGRLEAGRIEGYQYNPTLGTLDVSKPWDGPNDEHFDMWAGYSKRIFANKINWRIQVNLHNVLEKTRLVNAQYEPDGSLALARIQEGMTWQLTNSFDF
jgi:TonB-dependent Receptor Plug Domain